MSLTPWIGLAKQPLREKEWLFEIFSREHGRLHGSIDLKKVDQHVDILIPLQSEFVRPNTGTANDGMPSGCLQIKWVQAISPISPICQNKSDQVADWTPAVATQPSSSNYICQLYMAELIQKTVPYSLPSPALFDMTLKILNGLQQPGLQDPWLRLFEIYLLDYLGAGIDWLRDSDGEWMIDTQHYYFHPERGFFKADRADKTSTKKNSLGKMSPGKVSIGPIAGEDLKAIAQHQFDFRRLSIAKKILRPALEQQLNTPLISRQLLMV